MLQVSASDFIAAGESFAKIRPLLDSSDGELATQPLLDKKLNDYVSILQSTIAHCTHLQLPVTLGLIKQFIDVVQASDKDVSIGDAHIALSGIFNAFKVELSAQLFLDVLPHRVPYYHGGGSPAWVGHECQRLLDAVEPFPEATFDASEAGNCFAFERFTACVYHLMRVAEHGLVAVAEAAGATQEDKRSWDKLVGAINRHVKTIESQKPPNWLADRNKFSDMVSWFIAIKNGWRNPVSHVPRIYLEDSARGVFISTCTLFGHLKSHGFASVQMPKLPIDLPNDDGDAA